MDFKTFRNKAPSIAFISSLVCLVSSLWIVHLYLNRFADIIFWLSLLAATIPAVLSLPRWKSLAALLIVLSSVWWSGGRALATYHSTRSSPDGKYKLVTYSIPMWFAFPGQGSDASGYVQLQDSSGKVLNEGYVEMVQIVSDADWKTGEVQVGRGDGSYTWKLPQ